MSRIAIASRETLVDAATGEREPLFLDEPELLSDPKEWPSIHVEQRRFGAHERGPSIPTNHMVVVHLDGPADIEVADGGAFRMYRVMPGHVSVFPAGAVFSCRTRSSGRFYSTP